MRSRSGRVGYVLRAVWLSLSLFSIVVGASEDFDVAPDWTLQDGAGSKINFYQHSGGRPSVVLFWATWCPYCRRLMPHLEKIRQEVAPAVNFYALNIWEDGDPAAYMAGNGYGSQLLLAADDVAKIYGIKGTPGLIVVDKNHRVIYVRKSGSSPTQVASDLRFALGNLAR